LVVVVVVLELFIPLFPQVQVAVLLLVQLAVSVVDEVAVILLRVV
jgi:hypothetical protein